MRTVPFKEVLYDVALKSGQDPLQGDFLTNQAVPIGQSIDQWVRRVYSSRDFPEATAMHQFAPANHIVSWDAIALDLHPAQPPGTTQGILVELGKVLNVYLVDPRTTSAPVAADYTELDSGIHCGYEHGHSVWIKYLPPAPRFTADLWRVDNTYQKGDVVYSDSGGHCYKSLVSGNLGHDPATNSSPPQHMEHQVPPPISLPTEIVQPLTPGNPGIAATSQITELHLQTDGFPLNPPPAGAGFYVYIVEANVVVAGPSAVADGVRTLDDIATELTNDLIGAGGISGFTFNADLISFFVTAEKAGPFELRGFYAPPVTGLPQSNFKTRQVQAYVPTVSASDVTQQITDFPLSEVIPGATYTLTFRDVAGGEHTVEYVATLTDTADQVHTGLINAVQAAGLTDDFLGHVTPSFDAGSTKSSYASSIEMGVDAEVTVVGSAWWELVLMPLAIVDAVTRGAVADLLKEWGQTQEGMAEEQAVQSETGIAVDRFAPGPAVLTNQRGTKSGYRI